jgi:hypothetical protein
MVFLLLACVEPHSFASVVMSGPDFWDHPWPSDERTLGVFPTDGVGFLDDSLAMVTELDGWGTTSGIFFRVDRELPGTPVIRLNGGTRPVVLDNVFLDDGGPYGDRHMVAALPVQGFPLEPGTTYTVNAYDAEWTFTTQDPMAEFNDYVALAKAEETPSPGAWTATDDFDDYCVFESTVSMPVYQVGDPPFTSEGGTWTPEIQVWEEARIVVTLPRGEAPEGGWPTVVMSRTGGGGERPLVDHGPADAEGNIVPGTGVALDFALAGWAGVSVDGPHGGLRNITGGDEQFLMFNIGNAGAIRDNVRQSALELALVPSILESISIEGDCSGALDTEMLVLMGHSMGATIAPLTLSQGDYRGAILSGAGSSWIHNIVWKQSPLEVRPLAEAMLDHPGLHDHDPALSLVQWAAESADPPPYGAAIQAHGVEILMLQGIVDTYILPPMANATAWSLGLDLAGPVLDEDHPDLQHFAPMSDHALAVPLPWGPGAVTQHAEDGLQDGHEVMFQLQAPREQMQGFLSSMAAGDTQIP